MWDRRLLRLGSRTMKSSSTRTMEPAPLCLPPLLFDLQAWAPEESRRPINRKRSLDLAVSVTFLPQAAPQIAPDPTLWLYRGRTLALLRRFLRMSVEVGRVP